MEQYDDEEMGALDCEEIEGHIKPDDSRVLKLAEEYEHEKSIGIELARQIGKPVSFQLPFMSSLSSLFSNAPLKQLGQRRDRGICRKIFG